MKYTNLPNTDMNISQMTLGTWVFGGDVWGGTKKRDSINAVHAAIDAGVNILDTAPVYGFGVSEEVVGEAIAKKRDQIYIATKAGLPWEGKKILHDLSPANVERELHESLSRLKIDTIDLYQCHWPDENTPIEATMEILMKFKEQGKIRYIGVSNFAPDLIERARSVGEVVSLQSSFSLLERELEKEIIPYCKENNVGVLTYGVLGGGILSGKYLEAKTFPKGDVRSFYYQNFEGEKHNRIKTALEALNDVGRPHAEIAINWIRQQPGVTSVLVGCRNAEQVAKNVAALEWELNDEQIEFVRNLQW